MSFKIFMCCHKPPAFIPEICDAIQCGSALNPKIPNVVHDDKGDNISAKNREYCELTAHYYAWKNVAADYYGFCHYRRFFLFDEKIKKPYIAVGKPESIEPSLFGSVTEVEKLCAEYDIIIPRAEDMGISVQKHYETSQFHYKSDLKLFVQILSERFPALTDDSEAYLSQSKQYFCNMFIMDKPHFFEYCEMLFTVLAEFDRQKKECGDLVSDRTDGFLGEIFTGIYINHAQKNGAKIKEISRIDVSNIKKRISCAVFPPESSLRFAVKKWVKRLKRRS